MSSVSPSTLETQTGGQRLDRTSGEGRIALLLPPSCSFEVPLPTASVAVLADVQCIHNTAVPFQAVQDTLRRYQQCFRFNPQCRMALRQ